MVWVEDKSGLLLYEAVTRLRLLFAGNGLAFRAASSFNLEIEGAKTAKTVRIKVCAIPEDFPFNEKQFCAILVEDGTGALFTVTRNTSRAILLRFCLRLVHYPTAENADPTIRTTQVPEDTRCILSIGKPPIPYQKVSNIRVLPQNMRGLKGFD
jgi:hypothetical protein